MDPKSKLSVYCQRNGFSFRFEDQPVVFGNETMWTSTLIFSCNGNEQKVVGMALKSKKESQMSAAEILMAHLDQQTSRYGQSVIYAHPAVPSPLLSERNPQKVYTEIYMIDLENVHFFSTQTNNNVLYLGFISSIHQTLSRYTGWKHCKTRNIYTESINNNKLIFKAKGGEKDLVDHVMSMFSISVVDYIEKIGEKVTVNVMTKDKAGWCTAKCLDMELGYRSLKNFADIENVGEKY